ncbi:hypothetical protein EYZ11_004106 [Aspergillus tanneri]|uniref:Uncharacterized protein n=1 Tax=Aspergillus tanneri TaxID=1220188 RepID=A0A4S3JLD0_9EURO|nr:hypothetical protein EYZ11_004106 [Aspergillus tanneri]
MSRCLGARRLAKFLYIIIQAATFSTPVLVSFSTSAAVAVDPRGVIGIDGCATSCDGYGFGATAEGLSLGWNEYVGEE